MHREGINSVVICYSTEISHIIQKLIQTRAKSEVTRAKSGATRKKTGAELVISHKFTEQYWRCGNGLMSTYMFKVTWHNIGNDTGVFKW